MLHEKLCIVEDIVYTIQIVSSNKEKIETTNKYQSCELRKKFLFIILGKTKIKQCYQHFKNVKWNINGFHLILWKINEINLGGIKSNQTNVNKHENSNVKHQIALHNLKPYENNCDTIVYIVCHYPWKVSFKNLLLNFMQHFPTKKCPCSSLALYYFKG